MKKYLLALFLLLAGLNLYAGEITLSLGFEAPLFTFFTGHSLTIWYNVSDLITIDYTKIFSSLGFNIKGKFVNDSGIGGMFKAYLFYPYYMNSRITTSDSLYSVDTSETKYTTFEPAFIIGVGGAAVYRFYPSDKFNISIDVGGELEIDFIGVYLYNFLLTGIGAFADIAFEFYFNKNWFLDVGMNTNLLIGLGAYGHQHNDLIVTTVEAGAYVSPSISIGYKF